MPLGPERLHQLVNEIGLVEGLSDRELENPEGAGFDLRLGKVHRVSGEAFLGITERKTANSLLVAEYKLGESTTFDFHPGDQCLVTTIEKVNLPKDLSGNITLRSTLYRSGMVFTGGNVAPGYSGELSFNFYNPGKAKITIELGARVAHIQFERVEGGGNEYRGQWKGGRVSTDKMEEQI